MRQAGRQAETINHHGQMDRDGDREELAVTLRLTFHIRIHNNNCTRFVLNVYFPHQHAHTRTPFSSLFHDYCDDSYFMCISEDLCGDLNCCCCCCWCSTVSILYGYRFVSNFILIRNCLSIDNM